MPRFKARKYTGVERSQVEFERLETHLQATYPECLVPTLGPGTTASKYVPEYQNDRLVVQLLQQWLERVSRHPILRQDYELRQFVEAPFVFNPALSSSPALTMAPAPASSGSGFFSWGKTRQQPRITSGSTPFEQMLETTSANLGVFQRNAEDVRRWHGRLARARARLAVDLRDVGTKLVSVGVIEHNAQLARAFKRLGKSFLHAGPCAQTQANSEGSRTWAVLGLEAAACADVQRTLQCRQLIFTEHQVAERQLERKKQAAAVLRSSSSINPEQAQDAVAELAAAKADADNRRQRAERVDRVLSADLRVFEHGREGDIRAMFAALARDHLHIERQALSEQRAALEF
ncbi:Vacuolar protein sorting-associated protein 17, partial [Coemansia sp. RSA 2599]